MNKNTATKTRGKRSGINGTRKPTIKPGHGWAWTIKDTDGSMELCFWAEPTKARLLSTNRKPSNESKPVYVALVPMGLWRSRKTSQESGM